MLPGAQSCQHETGESVLLHTCSCCSVPPSPRGSQGCSSWSLLPAGRRIMGMCNTNDWLGQFIKALLRQLMSCEDKRETQDIRSPNLGLGPNFEIKFHPSEKSKGMTQLCACTYVCDPGNLSLLQIITSHRASCCPAGLGTFGGFRICISHCGVL